MPDRDSRQTLMFSATFPKPIQNLARDFLADRVFVSIGRNGSTTELVTQRLKYVEEEDKREELIKELRNIEGRTLIFATKRSADLLENFLYQNGFSTASIHGDRTQPEREAALNAFKNGKATILVATDVAARGLHIDGVVHVINFDLPSNIEDYVHRIGRTGRCGKQGIATAFYNSTNSNVVKELVHLLREANQEVPDWLVEISRETYSNKRKGKGYQNGYRRGYNTPNYSNNKRSNNNSTWGSNSPKFSSYNRNNYSDNWYDDTND